MANPDYETLLQQIAAETDPVAKQALIDQCYIFNEELTEEEKGLFDFVATDYFEDNPGEDDQGNYVSFIGIYINDDGEYSGEYP